MTDTSYSGSAKLTANIKAAGCAAKISASELHAMVNSLVSLPSANLLTGMHNFEDAAVYKLSDDMAVIQTTDFFPPPVDDPYTYGRIAAVNALSDVYAMGGTPLLALNIFCFPTCDYPLDVAKTILAGGADAVAESGAILAGGHSIQANQPIYGLSVMGLVHPERVLTNSRAEAGDSILITKPIGTGVGLLGLKGNVLSAATTERLLSVLTQLNKQAMQAALKHHIHAATDVTGFGLIGHLHEMAQASGLTACINANIVPLLPDVVQLASEGFVPAGAYANRNAYAQFVTYKDEVSEPLADLLFDPQTAGGLLLSMPRQAAESLLIELHELGMQAAIIGKFGLGVPGLIEVLSHD